jgi:hypothetical protein
MSVLIVMILQDIVSFSLLYISFEHHNHTGIVQHLDEFQHAKRNSKLRNLSWSDARAWGVPNLAITAPTSTMARIILS